jgi:hypothetical protein
VTGQQEARDQEAIGQQGARDQEVTGQQGVRDRKMIGKQEARGREMIGQQEARDREAIGQQEDRDREMKGQQEAQDRAKKGRQEAQGLEATALKEDPGRDEADSIGATGPGEGLKELQVQVAKDQVKGRHLETGHKAGVDSEGMITVILVNAEIQAAVGLEAKAEPGHNGHIMNVSKVEEETKTNRKKLFFKKTGAHQKVNF